MFDPLLTLIEQFQREHRAQVIQRSQQERELVFAPILAGLRRAGRLSRKAQFALTQEAFHTGEARFAEIARSQTKDVWMSLARRAPEAVLGDSALLLAAALVKHAAPQERWSMSVSGDKQHAMIFEYSGEDILATFALVALAQAMGTVRGLGRSVGKGARLVLDPGGALDIEVPEIVAEAIAAYERRRPGAPFRQLGLMAFAPPVPDEPVLPVLSSEAPLLVSIPGNIRLVFERWTALKPLTPIERLLRAYEEPIEHRWGLTVDTILHVLAALGQLVGRTLIWPIEDGAQLRFDEREVNFDHRLRFTFELSRRGFLRFPRHSLIDSLSTIVTPWAADSVRARVHSEKFFDSFTLMENDKQSIDLVLGSAVPFLHSSAHGFVYVDLLLLGDFLTGLLAAARGWFASQHGDRFVLALARMIEAQSSKALVAARRPVRLSSGAVSDADLLVRKGDRLLVVECKAHAKSAAFRRGEPSAVAQRRTMIRRAVQQARGIASALGAAAPHVDGGLGEHVGVEWAVCLPSQEFLAPLAEHGMLTATIPRVLTPEDLLEFLAEA